MNAIQSALGFGIDAKDFSFLQISLRGVIVFTACLIMLRLADRRFLSKKSAFDAILGFILASMLARAINGNSPFLPTLGCGFVLVFLHRFLSFLTRDNHWLGKLIKGEPRQIIENGVVDANALRENDLSPHDLLEDLRLNGNVGDPAKVLAAFYERNGQITVVK